MVEKKYDSPEKLVPYQKPMILSLKAFRELVPLEDEIDCVSKAWDKFAGDKSRDAIYTYLASVFEIVRRWNAAGTGAELARHTMRRCHKHRLTNDPSSALIVASLHPNIIDRRLVSKWSRALRYALKVKRPSEPFEDFMKRRGGISGCAALHTRLLKRRSVRAASFVPFTFN